MKQLYFKHYQLCMCKSFSRVSGFDEKFMDAALDESDIGRLELIGRNIDCHLLFKENNTSEVRD